MTYLYLHIGFTLANFVFLFYRRSEMRGWDWLIGSGIALMGPVGTFYLMLL